MKSANPIIELADFFHFTLVRRTRIALLTAFDLDFPAFCSWPENSYRRNSKLIGLRSRVSADRDNQAHSRTVGCGHSFGVFSFVNSWHEVSFCRMEKPIYSSANGLKHAARSEQRRNFLANGSGCRSSYCIPVESSKKPLVLNIFYTAYPSPLCFPVICQMFNA